MYRQRRQSGFTLFELAVVIALVAVVMAVALPQLAPALTTGKLEGAARRLAGYGRAALAHSAFSKEPLVFRIDMDKGEYWTVRRIVKEDSLFLEEEEASDDEETAKQPLTKDVLLEVLSEGSVDEQSERLIEIERQFDDYFRFGLEARARNVKHDGLLAGINPLEDAEFKLKDDEGEIEEEIKISLLERTYVPPDVRIQRVIIGAEEFTKGIVDIEVTPMGLYETVEVEVGSEEGGLYRITLDPITGGTHLAREE
ncbi:MAG: hypothetical protein AMXMBFR84_02190 [Candidatus Hydrogenedentota bacterium]